MSTRSDRIDTVLRVRRAQEAEAAGGLGRAGIAVREAERALAALMDHYEQHRHLDLRDDAVPDRLRDRERRTLHAQAIQRGRDHVRATLATMEEHRALLQARTQAVRAMERLAARVEEDAEAERSRRERRDQDELATTRWSQGREEDR